MTEKLLKAIVKEDLIEACATTALMIKKNPGKQTAQHLAEYQHAPISVFPTPFPFHLYKDVYKAQTPVGCLVSSLVAQPEKIESILSGFLKYDAFLERLVGLSKDYNKFALSAELQERKKIQEVQMVVLRNDFMIDVPSNSVKLVEYNTIASSFGVLSEQIHWTHRYVRDKYGDEIAYNYSKIDPKSLPTAEDQEIMEFANEKQATFVDQMVDSFHHAITHYKQSLISKYQQEAADPWVLFVVEDSERNVIDQKSIETSLHRKYGIKSLRMTFAEIHECIQLNPETHVLKVRGKEIGFVYYRVGYQVEQYPNEEAWDTRRTLEVSQAVKCPSIDFHLTTFKKFQQSFCNEKVLKETLLPEFHEQQLPALRTIFSGMWSLEDYEKDPDVQAIVQKAIDNPTSYVVKPQKEGGGNNFYDDDAKALLEKFRAPETSEEDKEKMKQFMIMERIYPPFIKAWMLRDGDLFDLKSLSEIGLYSSIFVNTGKVDQVPAKMLTDDKMGTLMRTKGSHSNEGGVNTGYSVIDHPILYVEETGQVSDTIKSNVESF